MKGKKPAPITPGGTNSKSVSTPGTTKNQPSKSAFTSPSKNNKFSSQSRSPSKNKEDSRSLATPSTSSRDSSDADSPKTPMTVPREGAAKVKKKRRTVRKWTQAEDEQMRVLVDRFGTRKWSTIGGFLEGRNGKQCRERWHNQLDPSIKKSAWTEDEEVLLKKLHDNFGNKWAEIARHIPGRTDNAIKNHWNSQRRRVNRAKGPNDTKKRKRSDGSSTKKKARQKRSSNNSHAGGKHVAFQVDDKLSSYGASGADWSSTALSNRPRISSAAEALAAAEALMYAKPSVRLSSPMGRLDVLASLGAMSPTGPKSRFLPSNGGTLSSTLSGSLSSTLSGSLSSASNVVSSFLAGSSASLTPASSSALSCLATMVPDFSFTPSDVASSSSSSSSSSSTTSSPISSSTFSIGGTTPPLLPSLAPSLDSSTDVSTGFTAIQRLGQMAAKIELHAKAPATTTTSSSANSSQDLFSAATALESRAHVKTKTGLDVVAARLDQILDRAKDPPPGALDLLSQIC